ncbi:MAG: hypothetical protein IBX44_09775 [Sulfurospirillum sp.]|nr:hypothetical protein [Sulfurospirillum sp.]
MKKLLLVAAVLFSFQFAVASDTTPEESLQVIYGGQLYDKWFKVAPNAKTPKDTHAAYPQDGKYKGNATWRCKECHGWDLKGKDGGYAKGKHFTGIKGLQDYAGKPIAEIAKVITNDTHAYKGLLGEKEVNALALFVSKAQLDPKTYVDGKTPKGDKVHGAKLYNGICVACHGLEGRNVNVDGDSKEVLVGELIRSNPVEIMHKLRFGHPGAKMTELYDLPVQYLTDILAYGQDLK